MNSLLLGLYSQNGLARHQLTKLIHKLDPPIKKDGLTFGNSDEKSELCL